MGDASESSKEWAGALVPEAAHAIEVLGDIKTDRMLMKARDRPPTSKHLLVMSTWGPNSLMESAGMELCDSLERLVNQHFFSVSITTHPRLWTGEESEWQRRLRSLAAHPAVEVLAPGDSWIDAMADSAIALSDHTSLVGLFALLRRPIVLASAPADVLGSGTLTEFLYRHCPIVEEWSDLPQLLLRATEEGMPNAVWESAQKILSYPGEAEVRTVNAARRLLQLDPEDA
jgi:hypothetical protein